MIWTERDIAIEIWIPWIYQSCFEALHVCMHARVVKNRTVREVSQKHFAITGSARILLIGFSLLTANFTFISETYTQRNARSQNTYARIQTRLSSRRIHGVSTSSSN